MDVFQERNLIVPTRRELFGGLFCWIAYLLLFPLVLSMLPFFQEDSLRSSFLYNLAVSVSCFILVLLVFRKFLYRSKLPMPLLLFTGFWGFLGAYGLNNLWGYFLQSLVMFLPVTPSNMNQETIDLFLRSYSLPMVLNVVILAPVVEELLFRGAIFAPLCRQKGPVPAYIASMVAFAALHVVSYIGQQHWLVILISFLEYLPAGLMLGWSYQRARSIWAPIVVHALLNLVSSMLIL